MTTLRVIADHVLAEVPDGTTRYARELTKQLIVTAPAGCDVEAIVSAHDAEADARLRRRLPGLARVHTLSIGARELSVAWQMGVKVPYGRGMIHSPGLLAPLFKHDIAGGDQTTVTVHELSAWLAPDTVSKSESAWQKAMLKRARKYADAVVVPTHAIADQLNEIADFGDRIRVIGGAPTPTLALPKDADGRAARLGLPERYIATVSDLDPRKGLRALIQALALPAAAGLPLVVAGLDAYRGETVETVAMSLGLPEGRVRALGILSDEDLALTLARAEVFVYPNLVSGFGLPVIEAMRCGTPVVHSDDAAVTEVAFGAGLPVARDDAAGYPARLADAVGAVLSDARLAEQLRFAGADRAAAFSWRDSAERVWALHAEL